LKRFGIAVGLTCLVLTASAQTPIRPGSFELGTFVGSTYNVSQGAVMGGANISYAVTKIFLPYIEYSYFPSIQRTATGTFNPPNDCGQSGNQACSFTANYPTHAIDFHGGVHVRFQIRESHFAPYGVFGIGTLGVGSGSIKTYLATNFAYPVTPHLFGCDSPGNPAGCTPLNPIPVAPGTNSLAVNFGGGLRYYVTPRYGFRVEVKGYKPLSSQQPAISAFQAVSVTNTFLKAEVGFFLQFR
jgi:hypothetical protein